MANLTLLIFYGNYWVLSNADSIFLLFGKVFFFIFFIITLIQLILLILMVSLFILCFPYWSILLLSCSSLWWFPLCSKEDSQLSLHGNWSNFLQSQLCSFFLPKNISKMFFCFLYRSLFKVYFPSISSRQWSFVLKFQKHSKGPMLVLLVCLFAHLY